MCRERNVVGVCDRDFCAKWKVMQCHESNIFSKKFEIFFDIVENKVSLVWSIINCWYFRIASLTPGGTGLQPMATQEPHRPADFLSFSPILNSFVSFVARTGLDIKLWKFLPTFPRPSAIYWQLRKKGAASEDVEKGSKWRISPQSPYDPAKYGSKLKFSPAMVAAIQ